MSSPPDEEVLITLQIANAWGYQSRVHTMYQVSFLPQLAVAVDLGLHLLILL